MDNHKPNCVEINYVTKTNFGKERESNLGKYIKIHENNDKNNDFLFQRQTLSGFNDNNNCATLRTSLQRKNINPKSNLLYQESERNLIESKYHKYFLPLPEDNMLKKRKFSTNIVDFRTTCFNFSKNIY